MKVSRTSRLYVVAFHLCVVAFMLVYGVGWSVAVPQSLQLHTAQSLTGTVAVGEGCPCGSPTSWYPCASYPRKNCETSTGGCQSGTAGTCEELDENCYDDPTNCAGRSSYGCVV